VIGVTKREIEGGKTRKEKIENGFCDVIIEKIEIWAV